MRRYPENLFAQSIQLWNGDPTRLLVCTNSIEKDLFLKLFEVKYMPGRASSADCFSGQRRVFSYSAPPVRYRTDRIQFSQSIPILDLRTGSALSLFEFYSKKGLIFELLKHGTVPGRISSYRHFSLYDLPALYVRTREVNVSFQNCLIFILSLF